MKKFEVLEHKADLKIRVFGKDKKELFLNALLGMSDSMRAESFLKTVKSQNIKVKSPDIFSLLVDFLSEILYYSRVNRIIYDKIKFQKFTDTEIKAEVSGRQVKRIGLEIKGVTYHNLEIKKRNNHWEAIILFDI